MNTILLSGWAMPGEQLSRLPEAAGLRGAARCFDFCELTRLAREKGLAPANGLPGAAAVAELEAVLRQAAEPVLLAGWSLGGLLALEAARQRPEKVHGLLLISSTACFCSDQPERGVPVKRVRTMRRMLRRSAARVLERFYADCAWPETAAPEWIAQQLACWTERDPGTERLAEGLAYLEQRDLQPEIKPFPFPVRVLHGAQDRIIPLEAGARLAELTGGVFSVMDGGHRILLDHPERAGALLKELADE
jgi:pimeloyl-[acyl-carrier protein] methyl ester esterase